MFPLKTVYIKNKFSVKKGALTTLREQRNSFSFAAEKEKEEMKKALKFSAKD